MDKLGNRGQGQLINLFIFLIIYLALSVAWFNIAATLITNFIVPSLVGQQFASLASLLLQLGAFVLWSIIPIAIIGAALRGQEIQA